MKHVWKSLEDEKATFASDGNVQYTCAILENFDVETIIVIPPTNCKD